MKLYWVSCLIKDSGSGKVWLMAMCNGNTSLSDAMSGIETMRAAYTVVSAWVDTFDENKVKTVEYHECFVDGVGNVSK